MKLMIVTKEEKKPIDNRERVKIGLAFNDLICYGRRSGYSVCEESCEENRLVHFLIVL